MTRPLEEIRAMLHRYGQEHLLSFYEELTELDQTQLLQQIMSIDFDAACQRYENHRKNQYKPCTEALAPLPFTDSRVLSETATKHLTDAGLSLMERGQVAALVVAGGQGSRLGHDGPKGTFDIGLPSHKSLFQLQAERLINLSRRVGRTIPWYIMTSPDNDATTRAFFAEHQHFGYPASDILFFAQSSLPPVDPSGRMFLASKSSISLAPSGNGDCFEAMDRSGVLADMKKRGVEWLFYYNVDNALIRVADPAFVGFVAESGAEVGSKVIERRSPEEPVGILCQRDGRPYVVEYTDIPPEISELAKRDPAYNLANISIHLFRVSFLERMSAIQLPVHAAFKRISYVDATGMRVWPSAPNALKFERFFFDAFPYTSSMAVWRVERDSEFAPVKNRTGQDSAASARELVFAQHRAWLMEAGMPGSMLDRDIEISPLTSYGGEGLNQAGIRESVSGGALII